MNARTFFTRLPRWTWLTIGTVAVVVVSLSIWVFGFALPALGSTAEAVTRTATVERQTLEKTVSTSGAATPAVQEDVSFSVSGTVTAVHVEEGDEVTAGQELATVDTLQLKASLLEAKAGLAEAKAGLASAKSASDGSRAATSRITAASAAVEVAKEAVAEAEAAMADAALVAPAAGLVTNVGIEVGDKVSGSTSGGEVSGPQTGDTASGSTAAFTIVSTDAWTVDVTVGETDVEHVEKGLQVEMSTDDGDTYFGVVSEVGRLPSTTSGSAQYPVAISITGDGEGLFDGVSVDVEIIYERRTDVLAIPSAAITTQDGASTVTVVAEDGTRTETTVEVGDSAGQYTEILSGLEEGATVLVAEFTPGEGNAGSSGGFPGGGMPGGGMPSGGFPGGGEMPSGGEPGGDMPSGGFPGQGGDR